MRGGRATDSPAGARTGARTRECGSVYVFVFCYTPLFLHKPHVQPWETSAALNERRRRCIAARGVHIPHHHHPAQTGWRPPNLRSLDRLRRGKKKATRPSAAMGGVPATPVPLTPRPRGGTQGSGTGLAHTHTPWLSRQQKQCTHCSQAAQACLTRVEQGCVTKIPTPAQLVASWPGGGSFVCSAHAL